MDIMFVNMKVLGKLGPGMKINTKGKYFEIDDTTWYQFAFRWFRGDNRDISFDKVQQTISQFVKLSKEAIVDYKYANIEINEKYLDNTPEEFIKKCKHISINVIKGLGSLKDTYIHDETFCCKIDFQIESIQTLLKLIEKETKNHFD